ncbi:hypothetical protein, partial [uncultured Helicobacter sp.]|uniref:hypothetical protein n=1 Tax=uncultured Helicobacter sp. TaxID=175537 RepID=UPI00374F8FAB
LGTPPAFTLSQDQTLHKKESLESLIILKYSHTNMASLESLKDLISPHKKQIKHLIQYDINAP